MSLQGKKTFNIFIGFIVILVYTETVTSSINYNEIRHDDEPYGNQTEEARTTREILEMFNNRAIHRPIRNFQQATEHLLQFGALLRIQILDTFGPLVYDHYDDYSIRQTEALYRVYQETLERKYNIFDIVPSVLRNPDLRPTKICRHIHKHVHTCLKESSMSCMTINKHDRPYLDSSLLPIVNPTRRMYKRFHIKQRFPYGFSLPAILRHLKRGTLHLTVGLMSGLLHNIQYDSFDDEVRTAERNVMTILTEEMLSSNRHKVLMKKDRLLHIHTVSDLLKELFELRKTMRRTTESNKDFAILSEHVVREVRAISRNIELLGTVYDNNTIDMKYLMDLILPRDVVDEDITDAKNYLLEKINDYDIVSKYLKVEKYQQSGPDQLLMEILGQMRDIGFAVDLATALHVHARFWRQSHMINNLNELLELFDAYKNLENVPKYSRLMSLAAKIRNTLWDSKNVTIETLCNNPRVCLRLGLETITKCELINDEIKNDINKLSYHLHVCEVVHDAEKCTLLMDSVEEADQPQTSPNPTTITEEVITDFTNREELVTSEVYIENTSPESEETSMTKTDAKQTEVVLTTEENAVTSTTTEIPTESLAINTEDTILWTTTSTTEDTTETMEQQTTDFTGSADSIDEELTTTPVTMEETVTSDVRNEVTTEAQATEDQTTEESRTTVHATVEPTSEEPALQETTTTDQTSDRLTEQTTIEEGLGTQDTTTTKQTSNRWDEQTTTEGELWTHHTTTTERTVTEEELITKQTTTDEELTIQETTSTEKTTTEEDLRIQEATTTEQMPEKFTEQSTTEEELTTQNITIREQMTTEQEPTSEETTTTEQTTTEGGLKIQKTTTTEQTTIEDELKIQETTTTEQTTTEEGLKIQKTTTTEQTTIEDELKIQETMTAEQRTSEEEMTTQDAVTTERMTESTESTEKSTIEEEMMTKTTATTTSTSAESTAELMIANETINPWSDDDCYGDECTTEILNDSTDILPSDAWYTVHSTPPPLSSNNARATTSLPVPTTTAIHTTGGNSIMSTSVPGVITMASSSLETESTTSSGKEPGLSKDPKSYSTSSSGEDCSGEACTSDDCSGERCRPHASPEVIDNSTDCPGTNCSIAGQTDCNEDDSCPSTSSADKCDDSDCKSNTAEQNYQQDCSGDGCTSAVEVSQETEGCEGDECSRPSSEWDHSSTKVPIANTSTPDCVDDDCSEVSKSNEAPCNYDDCTESDERLPSAAMQKTDPESGELGVHCDNKDPHHQRQLDKLKKIRIINELHAAAVTPPTRTRDRLRDEYFSNLLPPSRPTRRAPTKFRPKLPPWLRFPRDKITGHSLPWRPVSQQSFQAHNIEEEEFGQQSIESEMVRTKNRTKTKAYRNRNTNINYISLRGYVDGDIGDVATPEPPILQKVNPPNSSYRRVVTRMSNGLGSRKWDQKPQRKSDVNLKLKAPSKKSRDISRRREVSPMRMKPAVYQTKESDDNIERMRKNRSIIRAPQRASRRYLR